MSGIPVHENAQVKTITARPPKQTDPRGEGKRQQGQKEKKGQDPLLHWREGYTKSPHQKWRQLNVELPRLQSWPDDPRMTKIHPEDGPEKRSQEPNCSNSSNRDQIGRIWPEKGDPILREYQPAIQRRLSFDRVVGKPHSTHRVTPSRSNEG